MKIELGHLPDPDLNPNKGLHWGSFARAKREAKKLAMGLVLEQGRPSTPYDQAHITITWVSKHKRRRDIDNLFASMKAYIDGLVDARLIVDDSAKHVTYNAPRYEIGDKDNTIIEVEEIG
jgi:Holliday junction resolvase RusA-like endonuclease